MSNPEVPQRKRSIQKAAEEVRRRTQGSNKKKKPVQLVKLKVVDFTIWNGFKFGFGLMMGVAGFSITATIVAFLFKMFVLGLSNYIPV